MQSPSGEAPDGSTGREPSWREAIVAPVHHRNAGVRRGTTDWTQYRTTARKQRMRHWAVVENNTEDIENRKKQQLGVRNEERGRRGQVKLVRSCCDMLCLSLSHVFSVCLVVDGVNLFPFVS